MLKHVFFGISFTVVSFTFAQEMHINYSETLSIQKDSTKKTQFKKNIGNGYLPIGFFNLDLKYLIKFNQYEGFRTGLGGVTNSKFSERFRINTYLVYGFLDKRYKYSIGGGLRLFKANNTWLNISYTDDLQETGSSTFLTDKRIFSFFEPRLLNIDLFHRHITKSIALEHRVSNSLLSETQLATRRITPTYNYNFIANGNDYNFFNVSTAKLSLQWSPFCTYAIVNDNVTTVKDGFPKFTLQLTHGFKSVFDSDFNFSKLDFRTVHEFNHKNNSKTRATLVAGITGGDIPLPLLYHAYPNNIRKETILQRFSVAGLNSFETMYFNEFFSDKYATLQFKHAFNPFKISPRFRPQLVLISKYAIGEMKSINRHQNFEFNTLDHLYSESGFEINKLIFGFGLSFAYRYGAYHLPNFEDNLAFKFTFNLSL